MEEIKNGYVFLTVGKTKESTEATEFARYTGVASSYVLAVNPTKAEKDSIMGFESQKEPEYVKDGDNGKEVSVQFIVRTNPEVNNGIDIKTLLMFTLRPAAAYNKDQTKVQVVDNYGNSTWANAEDAKAKKKLFSANGNPLKIDSDYHIACVGEADLVGFLKKYVCVDDAFNYIDGAWVKKENAQDYVFVLEHIKDYFKGDFSELKEAIALQPNNQVKLLYGVRTTDDGKQYQAVASRDDLILPNNSGAKGLERLERNLANVKAAGSYANTEFRVGELEEYKVTPTNLASPAPAAAPAVSDDFWNS